VQSLSGSVAAVTGLQVPSVMPVFPFEHAWQSPVHAVLQQTPSTQLPLKHSVAPLHVVPTTFLQIPMLSHWLLPMQRFVGTLSWLPAGKLLHVPTVPVTAHDRHATSQAELQHTPSTQKSLRQALAAAQV